METKKKSILYDMRRTFNMWLVVRLLQGMTFITLNNKEFKLIREGKRQYIEKFIFADLVAESMVDSTLYQPCWIPWEIKFSKKKGRSLDFKYNYAVSLIESALSSNPPFFETMDKTTSKVEEKNFIKTTCYGDDFATYSGLVVEMLTKYKALWALPVIPSIAWVLSSILS